MLRHGRKNRKVQVVDVPHLWRLGLPIPTLLVAEFFHAIYDFFVLVGTCIITLKHRYVSLKFATSINKLLDSREKVVREQVQQCEFWLVRCAMVRTRHVALNKVNITLLPDDLDVVSCATVLVLPTFWLCSLGNACCLHTLETNLCCSATIFNVPIKSKASDCHTHHLLNMALMVQVSVSSFNTQLFTLFSHRLTNPNIEPLLIIVNP
jgi:hypothetical protein